MFANLTGWHFLIIALIVLLLFGATKLPALARSVGQSAKIFRTEIASQESSLSTTEAVSVPAAAEEPTKP